MSRLNDKFAAQAAFFQETRRAEGDRKRNGRGDRGRELDWAQRTVANLEAACEDPQLRHHLQRVFNHYLLVDVADMLYERVMDRVVETIRAGELRLVHRRIEGEKVHSMSWLESGESVGREEAADRLMELLADRITDLVELLKTRRKK